MFLNSGLLDTDQTSLLLRKVSYAYQSYKQNLMHCDKHLQVELRTYAQLQDVNVQVAARSNCFKMHKQDKYWVCLNYLA